MLIFENLMSFGKEIINYRNKVARPSLLVHEEGIISLTIINTQATMTGQENVFRARCTVNMQLACKCSVIARICFTMVL